MYLEVMQYGAFKTDIMYTVYYIVTYMWCK